MERSEPLAYLSEHDLPSMLGATMAVLVLMRPSSRRCAVYQAEIERLLANGELGGVPVGALMIDAGPLERLVDLIFGKDVPGLPLTIILREGQEVERFLTTRVSCLTRRVAIAITQAFLIPSLKGSTGGSYEWSRPNT